MWHGIFEGCMGKPSRYPVKVLRPKFKTHRFRNTTVPCGKINQFHLWTYCMYTCLHQFLVFITTFFLPKLRTFWTGENLLPHWSYHGNMEISDVFSDPTFGAMLDICRNRKMAESSSPDAISEEGHDMLSRERHENSVRVICVHVCKPMCIICSYEMCYFLHALFSPYSIESTARIYICVCIIL